MIFYTIFVSVDWGISGLTHPVEFGSVSADGVTWHEF